MTIHARAPVVLMFLVHSSALLLFIYILLFCLGGISFALLLSVRLLSSPHTCRLTYAVCKQALRA